MLPSLLLCASFSGEAITVAMHDCINLLDSVQYTFISGSLLHAPLGFSFVVDEASGYQKAHGERLTGLTTSPKPAAQCPELYSLRRCAGVFDSELG